jgi:S-ribosylhomocysteine lyase LuxS involved in autoinducer biosynthesis
VRVEQYYAFALYLGVNYLKILVDFVKTHKSQKAKKSLNIQITENPFQISKNPEKIDIKRVSAFEHSFAVYCRNKSSTVSVNVFSGLISAFPFHATKSHPAEWDFRPK